MGPVDVGVERRHRVDGFQAGTNGALGVVLVSLRVTEEDQQPVPEVLRDVPVEAFDDFAARLVVGAHDVAQVLGVELADRRKVALATALVRSHQTMPRPPLTPCVSPVT